MNLDMTQSASMQMKSLSLVLYVFGIIIRAATRENRSSGFPTRSDTNRPVQSQKQARSLKFLDLRRREIHTLSTICVAKTKALISFAVTAKLICAFVFALAKIRFSHDAAHMSCHIRKTYNLHTCMLKQRCVQAKLICVLDFFLRRVFRSYIGSAGKGQEYWEIHDQSGDIICMPSLFLQL